MWNLVLFIKKEKVFDSTGEIKIVKLLQIEKSCNSTCTVRKFFFSNIISLVYTLILYKTTLLLFLLFLFLLLFIDSTSEIFDAISVTFKNENFIESDSKFLCFLKAVREDCSTLACDT